MPSRHGLVIVSVAGSLAHVWGVRQRVSTEHEGATQVLGTIGALMQQSNLGTEEMLNQISAYANVAVTPGAANGYETNLKAVVQNIESQTEQSIKDGQAATQSKLDTLFQSFTAANNDANVAKTTADTNVKAWFECVADEQAKRQAAEAAEKSLTSSRSNENEACQLQQDNKDFDWDATGKYTLEFACDFGHADCPAAIQTFNTSTVQKMKQDALAALQKDQAQYSSLKATCDQKKQQRVQAQSAMNAADTAWSTKQAACKKLASRREASMCTYGSKVQAKCTAESEYTKLVSDTKQAKGSDHSEVDRETEWAASQTAKCMVSQAITKGLNSAVDAADLAACVQSVNFAQSVGTLNLRQGELAKLSAANGCAASSISFFNGQTWKIPAGAKPQSSAYVRAAFTPQLDPSAGNFNFCS